VQIALRRGCSLPGWFLCVSTVGETIPISISISCMARAFIEKRRHTGCAHRICTHPPTHPPTHTHTPDTHTPTHTPTPTPTPTNRGDHCGSLNTRVSPHHTQTHSTTTPCFPDLSSSSSSKREVSRGSASATSIPSSPSSEMPESEARAEHAPSEPQPGACARSEVHEDQGAGGAAADAAADADAVSKTPSFVMAGKVARVARSDCDHWNTLKISSSGEVGGACAG
jgi:hypothetical protein